MEFFHKVTRFPFMATRRRWYAVSAQMVFRRGWSNRDTCRNTAIPPAASVTLAAVTTTTRSNPIESTSVCFFRRFVRFPPSYPRYPPVLAAFAVWLTALCMQLQREAQEELSGHA